MPWKQKGQPFAGFSKGMSHPNPFFGCRKPSLLLCCKKQGGQGSFSKQCPVLPRNCCAACTSHWSQLSWNSFKGIDIWLCSIWKHKMIGNQPIFLLHLGIIRKIINIHRQANLQDQTESRLDLTRSPTTMTTVPSEAFLSKLSSVLEKAFASGLHPVQWLHLGHGFSCHGYNTESDPQQGEIREILENPWSCI